eukprot:707227-Pyramimonas_sp.AAC.1
MDGRCSRGQVDTLHRRLYECTREGVARAREEAEAPREFMDAARAEPDLETFTRGIFVYPDSELPKPSVSSEVEIFDVSGSPLSLEPERISELSREETLRLASDGSCSKPPIRALQRASRAIA